MGWNEKNHKSIQKMKKFQSLVVQRDGMSPSLLAERWNESLPAYCCRNTREQSDCATEEDQPIRLPQAPASWCVERILGVTIVLIDDDSVNWLPILLEMHRWRKTGWAPVDAKVLLWELPVCWINGVDEFCIQLNWSVPRLLVLWPMSLYPEL